MKIKAFIKSGKKEHIEKLQKNGELYFGSLKSYAKSDDPKRSDPLETAGYIEYLNSDNNSFLTLLDESKQKEFLKIKPTYLQIAHNSKNGFVYCMHCIDLDEIKINTPINFNLKDNACLLITNPVKFIEMIKVELQKKELPFFYSKVLYKDLKYYTGPKTVFEKDLRFKNEYEFRLFIPKRPETDHFTLRIGNIESISTLITNSSEKSNFKITEIGNE